MKYLLIAILFGGLGFYVFIYEPSNVKDEKIQEKTELQKTSEELGIEESTSYKGAITETYNKYKKGIKDAKSAALNIESRSRDTSNY